MIRRPERGTSRRLEGGDRCLDHRLDVQDPHRILDHHPEEPVHPTRDPLLRLPLDDAWIRDLHLLVDEDHLPTLVLHPVEGCLPTRDPLPEDDIDLRPTHPDVDQMILHLEGGNIPTARPLSELERARSIDEAGAKAGARGV